MVTLWQDVKYGARMLLKRPGFAAVAVLMLALGIGANTAIFSVVKALLLEPLNFRDPDRLAVVWEHNRARNVRTNVVSPANFLLWREQNTSFENLAAFVDFRTNLTGVENPEELAAQAVSVEMFPMLGVNAALGRAFTAEEGRAGGGDVVLLSDGLWRRRFGADPHIAGKSVVLNGQPHAVVGVMPPGFQVFLRQGSLTTTPAELWVPYVFTEQHRIHRGRFLLALGRLKPGVTLPQARAEMDAIGARLEREYPDFNTNWGIHVVPLHEQLVGDLRPALLLLLGAVGFVLLIACANVANLLLARAAARQREMAIRNALGAGRARIVRQLLTESVLLAGLAGAAGLLLAVWGMEALVALSPPEFRLFVDQVRVDRLVLAFTLGVSLLTGVLFGLAPALEAARSNLTESLKESGRSVAGSLRSARLRNGLIVAQVGLALVLLIGSGLLIQSFLRLQAVPPGFQAEHLLTARVSLPGQKYAENHQRVAFFGELLARVRSQPSVRAAGAISFLPFTGLGAATSIWDAGRPEPPPGQRLAGDVRVVDPEYFRTMGIPLLKGRYFTEREGREPANVVIVNEALARAFFPGEDPLGKRLVIRMAAEPVADEIIGVVADVKHSSLDSPVRSMTYWPHPRFPYPFMTVVVRAQGDPLALAGMVQREVQALDKEQPIADVRAMEQRLAESVARPRFHSFLLGLFAGVAALLAALGLYGVMAYFVAQRTHEIGIRMALGAERRDILRMVVGQGLLLALAGLAAGLAGAFWLTKYLAQMLYGIERTDPLTYAGVSALLLAVALAACYIPARRASRVDPMVALRYE